MKVIYAILLIAGWAWLPVAAALIGWRLRCIGRARLLPSRALPENAGSAGASPSQTASQSVRQ